MARKAIPDAIQRRDQLEQKLDPAKALRVAEAYLEAGRAFEALAYLERAEARERIEAVRDEAIEGGDVFLLREAAARLGEAPDVRAWERLAEAAAAAGKQSYAAEARRQMAAGEGA